MQGPLFVWPVQISISSLPIVLTSSRISFSRFSDGFFVPFIYCASRLWLIPRRRAIADTLSSGWVRNTYDTPWGSGSSYSKLSNDTSSSSEYQCIPSLSISYSRRCLSVAARRRLYHSRDCHSVRPSSVKPYMRSFSNHIFVSFLIVFSHKAFYHFTHHGV